MTTLANRPSTALLVVDVQNVVAEEAYEPQPVIATIAGLVERAREASVPVVWVRHHSPGLPMESPDWQIVAELEPAEGEPIVEKTYGDSFEDTDLEEVLASLGVGRLIVTGMETDMCIRSTIHGALTRGYDTILVSDAHTASDKRPYAPEAPSVPEVIAHANLYWSGQRAPGRTGGVMPAGEVVFEAR